MVNWDYNPTCKGYNPPFKTAMGPPCTLSFKMKSCEVSEKKTSNPNSDLGFRKLFYFRAWDMPLSNGWQRLEIQVQLWTNIARLQHARNARKIEDVSSWLEKYWKGPNLVEAWKYISCFIPAFYWQNSFKDLGKCVISKAEFKAFGEDSITITAVCGDQPAVNGLQNLPSNRFTCWKWMFLSHTVGGNPAPPGMCPKPSK